MTREEKLEAIKSRVKELYAETGVVPTKDEYNARKGDAPFFSAVRLRVTWSELVEELFPDDAEERKEAERRRRLELIKQKVIEMHTQTGRIPTRNVYNQLRGDAPKFDPRWTKMAWCDFVAQAIPGVQPGWTKHRGGNKPRLVVPPPPEVPAVNNWSTNGLLVLKTYTDQYGRIHYVLR